MCACVCVRMCVCACVCVCTAGTLSFPTDKLTQVTFNTEPAWRTSGIIRTAGPPLQARWQKCAKREAATNRPEGMTSVSLLFRGCPPFLVRLHFPDQMTTVFGFLGLPEGESTARRPLCQARWPSKAPPGLACRRVPSRSSENSHGSSEHSAVRPGPCRPRPPASVPHALGQ